MNACTQAIWQTKTPIDIQGRVFAVRRLIVLSMMPAGYLVAGPLADKVFEPMIRRGGRWHSSLVILAGAGPGRGIGLVFIMAGLFTFITQLAFYAYPSLRHIEDQVPEASASQTEQQA